LRPSVRILGPRTRPSHVSVNGINVVNRAPDACKPPAFDRAFCWWWTLHERHGSARTWCALRAHAGRGHCRLLLHEHVQYAEVCAAGGVHAPTSIMTELKAPHPPIVLPDANLPAPR
jgi:hypothetical protein